MANHRKYTTPTNTHIFWSTKDVEYLDKVRGKMARGEYLSYALHLSTKDKEFIEETARRNKLLEQQISNLTSQLREAQRPKNQNRKATREEELQGIRKKYFIERKDQFNSLWNAPKGFGLNWDKIKRTLRFITVIEAKNFFQPLVTPLPFPNTTKDQT